MPLAFYRNLGRERMGWSATASEAALFRAPPVRLAANGTRGKVATIVASGRFCGGEAPVGYERRIYRRNRFWW